MKQAWKDGFHISVKKQGISFFPIRFEQGLENALEKLDGLRIHGFIGHIFFFFGEEACEKKQAGVIVDGRCLPIGRPFKSIVQIIDKDGCHPVLFQHPIDVPVQLFGSCREALAIGLPVAAVTIGTVMDTLAERGYPMKIYA